ncbi:DNA-binding XRE family transcriptional regulator [Ancylobacter sp. 3268]|uniref:helix-turn-helix transcriptional regulator n=1 Tax=Ancylobacter sp. 3268 TaxID=2817752 RepID=UPI002863EE43|nr:helix-turn-helix transcriptional regulator [Ancylobacter sp. 3268]MDR6955210.1 DNA-binding XRE family transcriptional regulator [Ancylobacter sp. 3268]
MTGNELAELRDRWEMTVPQLAELLSMTRSQLQKVEQDAGEIEPRLRLAIERIALDVVVERQDLSLAPLSMRVALVEMMNAFNPVHVMSAAGQSIGRVSRQTVAFLRPDVVVDDELGDVVGQMTAQDYVEAVSDRVMPQWRNAS